MRDNEDDEDVLSFILLGAHHLFAESSKFVDKYAKLGIPLPAFNAYNNGSSRISIPRKFSAGLRNAKAFKSAPFAHPMSRNKGRVGLAKRADQDVKCSGRLANRNSNGFTC
jgi:hypothetical protein